MAHQSFNVIFVFIIYFVLNTNSAITGPSSTLYVREDPPPYRKPLIYNADDDFSSNHDRNKRETPTNVTISSKVNRLNDTHKQLMVHWVGEGSNVIICLARDPVSVGLIIPGITSQVNPSTVYISYDYGDTYVNKTDLFKTDNGSYATMEKFYTHPKYNTHFVFTDLHNKLIFVTSNHGRNITRVKVDFEPSDVMFHEYKPQTFLVLDKSQPNRKLWLTEDFGASWRMIEEYVKSVFWFPENEQTLVVQRQEPNGLSVVLFSSDLFETKIVFETDIIDFYIKSEYAFYTKRESEKNLALFISHKLSNKIRCIFDTELDRKGYHVADVTGNKALIAVSHTDQLSHLYVSESLEFSDDKARFLLSLESVLCYFPNNTWKDSWLHHLSDEAFADVYKVEGLKGIYIASQVSGMTLPAIPLVYRLNITNLGPQHLMSVITFDHGSTWNLIPTPEKDMENQKIACLQAHNCSLHLSQRFSQLYPDTRSVSILTSKSAPGLIVATGVIGKSLKGHFGVYISTDAGLTWRQTLRDLYFFNMGDHGGVLVAVKYFKSRGETRHVLYSTDEGEKWTQAAFHDEDLRLYGLMTEPGENTTVFTMFGSAPGAHQWVIVKLDLRSVFTYNCSKDDYKPWSPSQSDDTRSSIPCVMGKQETYDRRIPHANCYSGFNYDRPIMMLPCQCDAPDYTCDFGFYRSGKSSHCIRNKSENFDPYTVPSTCNPGQFYNRTKGYAKIDDDACIGGFEKNYLPDLIPCPFGEVQQFLLVAQRDRIVRIDLDTKELQPLPIHGLHNVIALDFDMKNNCVYWADIVSDTIGRQCLDNGNASEILVSSELSSIEGMALDWISHTLYFVDGMRAKIEMIRVDINQWGRMRRTVLNNKDLIKPRGIAVHPTAGYLYWTDWAPDSPTISRSNLDGTHILRMFTKPNVEWPNGITIDHIAERVYWVDARNDYVASCDLHGEHYKKILSNDDRLLHPFAVAVFKDNMYWDDWKQNGIFTADKDHGISIAIVHNQLPGLMDLKVYAHSLQEGTNGCVNSTCAYICVGAPKGGSSCLCPDGMEMKNGKCMCPGGVQPFSNMTCPKIANTCSVDHFPCNNGICIPKGWKCDNQNDCGDNSDETQCGPSTCASNMFVCGEGKCIPQYWKCDYERDCADGSDEMNCPQHNCTLNQFACHNGRCISNRWKCDGENDCRDGSDEIDCAGPEPNTCKAEEFTCSAAAGRLRCIPAMWRCDGEMDCQDQSDEANCTNSTCLDWQFQCVEDKHCIYNNWVCDGDNDCKDGSDEANCTHTTTTMSPYTPFVPATSCLEWMFQCANKKCIPYWWKCDNVNDCGDGSDELGCRLANATTTVVPQTNTWTPTVCKNNFFRCESSAIKCIPIAWVCDGAKDCDGGEDESECLGALHCTIDQFKCRMDGSCISLSSVCNGQSDCPDGSDEASCQTDHNVPSGPPSCVLGFFSCDQMQCLPMSDYCNGKQDCYDNFDEQNCDKNTERVYQVMQMGVDERGINDSSLLLYWWTPIPEHIQFQFLPSISQVGDSNWMNMTWTDASEYRFTKLKAFTRFNMTVYVRVNGSSKVSPPAKYYIATTGEGIPSEPWNVSVSQKNESHVHVTWQKPAQPNGNIMTYEIFWAPPIPPIAQRLPDNRTEFLLTGDFQADVEYKFWVVAHNREHESNSSSVCKIKFDGDADLAEIQGLQVDSVTDNEVKLSWKSVKSAEGYVVAVDARPQYPRLPSAKTYNANITIDNLAPGVYYTFKVHSFKKNFIGMESTISKTTTGVALPEIVGLQVDVLKHPGTAVKLTWDPPKDARKVLWQYGVYYAVNTQDLFAYSRLNTSSYSATVTQLEACEQYLFAVGIVGPIGVGPLSRGPPLRATYLDPVAPPKRLTVMQDPQDQLKLLVQWSASCPAMEVPVKYVITVWEKSTNQNFSITTPESRNAELSQRFTITYGGVYDIRVSTSELNARPSPFVTYQAPPIMPPQQVHVRSENNGSFIVFWQERDLPLKEGTYKYEIIVSEGNTLNETTGNHYLTESSPFVLHNATAKVYSFAVRLKTDEGYMSLKSEVVNAINPEAVEWSAPIYTTSSLISILVPALLLLIVLGVILTILIVRHRRLQNSFSRFANSHYDTRSGAATFDGDGLDEDETPAFRGFADDEPMVIA